MEAAPRPAADPPIELIVGIELQPNRLARLRAAFTVHYAPTPADRAAAIAAAGDRARAVLTNGSTGWSADQIAALPRLEIILALGAGYENIDLAAARRRGIVVTNGAGANDSSVADHAMALLLAVVRDIPQVDRAVRQGAWKRSRGLRPSIAGKRLGIIGLGTIGTLIARRASGFDLTIAYHNRRPRAELPFRYVASPRELARDSDFLIVACPGGAATFHLVDRAVLEDLGPAGFLVNIARGSVVDTEALIAALRDGGIAGAALDVIEGEPAVPDALTALPNIVFTPHIAGRSPEAAQATLQLALDNLSAHFSGRPVLTPVP